MATTHAAAAPVGTPDPETRALPTLAYVVTGLATLALGVIVLAWPDKTLAVVAALFGVQLIVSGTFQVVGAIRSPATAGVKVLLGALGVAGITAGVICLFRPFTSLGVLVLLIAIGWFAQAIADVTAGIRAQGGRRYGLLALGLLVFLGAMALLLWPALSLLVMVRVAGWVLVGVGLVEILSVFTRSTTRWVPA